MTGAERSDGNDNAISTVLNRVESKVGIDF